MPPESVMRMLIVVTAHRRESFGPGFDCIRALWRAWPHWTTSVVDRYLRACPNVLLIDPLDDVSFVDLMRRSYGSSR
jgi:hypothetical protein